MPKRRDGGGVIVERVPNLFWHSTDMQQLRHHRAFYSLPSEGDVVLEGRHAARFVRQDSDLWSQLHQGVLTTGSLKDALGFFETQAAKALRLSRHVGTGHKAQLRAYQQLSEEPLPMAAAGSCPAAARANAAARWARNFGPNRPPRPPAAVAGDAAADEAAAAQLARDAYCQRMAAGGQVAVCTRWGLTQEAASLHAVLQLFPGAVLEEAGLHIWRADQLPREWGISGEDLPLLGASPDAIICHMIHLDAAAAGQLRQAAAQLVALQRSGAAELAGASQQLMQRLLALVACEGDCSRGSTPEAAAQQPPPQQPQPPPPPQQARPGMETGAEPAAGQWGQEGELLQALQAAVQALSLQERQEGAAAASSTADSSGGSSSGGVPVPGCSGRAEGTDPVSTFSRLCCAHPGMQDTAASLQRLEGADWLCVRECVEVKNTCCFQEMPTGCNKKGRPRRRFVLSDPGPRQAVLPLWVPQLQMHMAATGCCSVLVVSRSATKGCRVYRMFLDLEYLRLCLQYVCKLQRHVRQGRPPPQDAWSREPDYKRLLALTCTLARRAQLVCEAEQGQLDPPSGSDSRPWV